MKYRLTLNCFSALDEAIGDIAFEDEDAPLETCEATGNEILSVAKLLFRDGEYLTVDVDTDAKTCKVVPVGAQ